MIRRITELKSLPVWLFCDPELERAMDVRTKAAGVVFYHARRELAPSVYGTHQLEPESHSD